MGTTEQICECGAVNRPGVKFCTTCGRKLEENKPVMMDKPARFCRKCGTPMGEGIMFCPNCGEKVISKDPLPQENKTVMPREVIFEETATIPDVTDDWDYDLDDKPIQQERPVRNDVPRMPEKKSHTGLIITLAIILTLIIAGSGVFLWMYYTDNMPDLGRWIPGFQNETVEETDEETEEEEVKLEEDEEADTGKADEEGTDKTNDGIVEEEYTVIGSRPAEPAAEPAAVEEPEVENILDSEDEEEPEPEPEPEEEYIIPDSDTRIIDEDELDMLNAEECRIARNEIYARHGRRFTDSELQEYFDSKSWYEGTIDPDKWKESNLSKIERKNADTIAKYEKKMGYR